MQNRCACTPEEDYLRRYREILDNMICGMTKASMTDSISHNFIVQMIPHHLAAIEMSYNILRCSQWAPVNEIAQGIITAQMESIGNMTAVLPCCSACRNHREDNCLYNRSYREITRTMFEKMRCARSSGNLDADFMREMIPHHRGAVRMSENALRFVICQELIPILDAIITSQKEGIRRMEGLLADLGQ